MMTIIEVNVVTGEKIEREMTEAEILAIPPYAAPPVVIPSISSFQARAALYQMDMLATVEEAMTAPTMDPIAKLAWDKAQDFNRDSPTILALAPTLGFSDTQLDDIFRFAKTIVT